MTPPDPTTSTPAISSQLAVSDPRPVELDTLLREYTVRSSSLTMEDRMRMMDLRIKVIDRLRGLLSGEFLASVIKCYKNSPLGFMTDEREETKDKDGYKRPGIKYTPDQVRDCMIEALLSNLNVSDNEFNIIGGRMYATRGGYAALIRRSGRFSHLKINVDVPVYSSCGDGATRATVKFSATWKYDGKPDDMLDHEVPIKVNRSMGDDAVIGKAYRKIYARIYSQATGSNLTDGDASEANMTSVEATVSDVSAPKIAKKSVAKEAVEVEAQASPAPTHTAADLVERIEMDGLTVGDFESSAVKSGVIHDGVTIQTASQGSLDAMYSSYDIIIANMF